MKTQNFETKLRYYFDAAYSLLAVESHEEGRCIGQIRRTVALRNVERKDTLQPPTKYYEWNAADGLIEINPENGHIVVGIAKTTDPMTALNHISGLAHAAVVVLCDFHPYLSKAEPVRKLRNLGVAMSGKKQSIICLSPRLILPTDLQKAVQFIEYGLPTPEELSHILDATVASIQREDGYNKFAPTPAQRQAIIEAACGMTSTEADNAFSLCTIAVKRETGKISMGETFARLVFEEKIVNLKNGFLEYVPIKQGFESVGGMAAIKAWAKERRTGFEQAARDANLPYPKGALIAGFAGTGKTLTAMAIAGEFDFPLFKLDIGKIFGSKVGESEANVRELIRLMEGLGRCVIMLDEMEKSLNESAVTGSGDSGVSSRVFGTLLSWLSLKICPTFLIGTVNDVERLPAALTRKGRFDEVWFCDLPDDAERAQIFSVLLEYKFKRKPMTKTTLDALVEKTRDFTGSEIESAIEDALYALLGQPKKIDLLLPEQLVKSLESITPQAQLNPSQVEKMRANVNLGFRLTSGKSKADAKPPLLNRNLTL